MTTAGDDQLRAMLETYLANMNPADFRALVYRVRPPGEALPLSALERTTNART